MICPFMTGDGINKVECVKEECAIYQKQAGARIEGCIFLDIGDSLSGICDRLGDLFEERCR